MKAFTIFCAAALATVAAHAQVSPDRVLIVVNGEAIKGRQYYTRMEVLPGVGRLVGEKFVPANPGFLTLQQLISEKLMIQLAKQQGVSPTQAEIDAGFNAQVKQNPKILEAFKTLGMTDEDLKYDIMMQLCEFKITTKGITITDQEIEKFYKDHVSTDFTLPKRYLLRVISVRDDEGQKKVDSALAAGKNFGDVAREHSIDSNSFNSGVYGEIEEAALTGKIKDAVLKTKKGSVTEWLVSDTIRAKFWVENVYDPKVVPLEDGLKREIRQRLMIDRGSVKNNMVKLMADMRKNAKFEFQGTPFDEQLKAIFQSGG